MNDDQLQFDRICHVIYSKPCKAEIREKIAHHYPESQREAVWERVVHAGPHPDGLLP